MAKLHWKEVEALAKAHHLEKSTTSLETLSRALQWWWCQKYNRPFKDELLQKYTLDELLYEFLRYYFSDPENDPRKTIESEMAEKEEDAWLQQQMAEIKKKNEQLKPLTDGLNNLEKKEEAKKVDEKANAAQLPDLPDISTKFDE